MMKVGGLWVSPIEIENTLMEHPAVLESGVVSDKDADGLLKPKAYILLKNEYKASDELKVELQNHVKSKLAALQISPLGRVRRRPAENRNG